MVLYNKSHLTIFDSVLLCELKKLSQILAIPWAGKKSLILFLGLWLLTGVKAEVAHEHGLTSSQLSINKSEHLKINLQGNRLSIEAKQASWQELLAKLKEQTHISIQSARPMTSIVTVSIPSLPVTEALQQLFNHRFDFVFLFSEQNTHQTAVPKAVWLFGNAIENVAQVGRVDGKKTHDKPNPDKTAVNDENETVQELIDKARNEENPELRIQALASLSGRQEQADKSAEKLALEAALDDKEASVRQYAVQALASQGGQAATEYLREALDDPDAGVRMQAVESVAPEGQGIALLQEALSNPDELVQTMAEERLKQVNQ